MLEGRLVKLRAREPADAETILPWLNDPEVKRYLGSRYPWSLHMEQEYLREQTAKPMSFGDVVFVVETKDGRAIGTVGLHGMTPENRQGALGIMIGEKDCWSKGYGTDTIVTLLRFAFADINLHRVELEVFADNARGIACYRKCGFVEEVRRRDDRFKRGAWHDDLVMGVLSHEFDRLHGIRTEEEAHA